MDEYGKTSQPHDDEQKVQGATEAANQMDNEQPSHWTTGKQNSIKNEMEIAQKAVDESSKINSIQELMANAEKAESQNVHDSKLQNGNVQTIVKVNAETPEEFTGLRVEKNHHTAAGLPAVISTMSHGFKEMGVIRTLRTFTTMNQKGGFDCQSCAWPDPDGDRHIAEFCENGAKAVAAEGTLKRVTPEFFKQHSVAELSQKSDYWLDRQGRITQPMFLKEGATHYEPISWENAFDVIAGELNKLESPNDALFYTSGRASNEAAYLYQLFVRQFGTNNLPDCSNMCHESSGTALTETIGIGKGTVKLEDFEKADLILILGQNPGTNHPRMLTTLEHAKRKGAKIVGINPLPEAGLMNVVNPNPQEYPNPLMFPVRMLTHKGVKLSDLYLPVKINGDMALLKGMMKVLFEEEAKRPTKVLDQEFIAKETTGFAELEASLDKVSWSDIIEQSGLTEAQIREVATIYMNSERVITCWAMGLTQQKNAVGTIQEVVNLHLLRGQIGKEGAGLCPVRGHSNVQGDRTVGIWERPREEFLKALDGEFNFTAPREHGFDTVEAIKAMYVGKCKTFFALGGNFLSATPDTEYTAKALKRTDLTVQAITKLNRTALITGKQSLILPVLGRSEIDMQTSGSQFVSCENSMGVVQMSKGILKPASEDLRSEVWIVANLAKATLGAKSTVDWDALAGNYDVIRDKIERTIPGFDDYNFRVREAGGFYLPNKPREGNYPTATKKANFTTHELPIHKLNKGELVMMTIRTHDQFNTTIYGLDDRYRGIHGERRVIMMNPSDIKERGFKSGEVVDLTSHFDDGTRHAKHFIIVPYEIPKGNCATYFPETNVLVPIGHAADRSNTPVSKFIIITVAAHVGKNGKPEFAGKFDYDYSANSQPQQISTNGHAIAKKSSSVKALNLLKKLDFQNIVKAAIIVAVAGSAVNALLSSNDRTAN